MNIREIGNTVLRYTPKSLKYLFVLVGCFVKTVFECISGSEKEDIEESVFFVECSILGVLEVVPHDIGNRDGWLTIDELWVRTKKKIGSGYPERYIEYAIKNLLESGAIEGEKMTIVEPPDETASYFETTFYRFLDDSNHKPRKPKKVPDATNKITVLVNATA